MLGGDRLALGEHDRATNAPHQFPDIAGPFMGQQRGLGLLGEPRRLGALGRRPAPQGVRRKQQDVGAAVPQRRHLQRQDIQAEQEVLAEPSALDMPVEVLIGRRDDAYVQADRLVTADALDSAFFQKAQQEGLQIHRHVADLVEKQRAPVGGLDAADAPLHGVGKGSLLVAEQFGRDQRGRNARAVNVYEGTSPHRGQPVDVFGQ